jgi:hypothetical protein
MIVIRLAYLTDMTELNKGLAAPPQLTFSCYFLMLLLPLQLLPHPDRSLTILRYSTRRNANWSNKTKSFQSMKSWLLQTRKLWGFLVSNLLEALKRVQIKV